MELVTIINTGVGIIGIIVGIIGWKSLTTAIKIRNTVKGAHDSTIQQAQIINNGLDSYAVIKLSKETTQAELAEIVKRIDELPKIIPHKEGEPYPKSKHGDLLITYKD